MSTVPVAAQFVIKRQARRPYIRLLVKDQNGDAFDFTGAVDATFLMYDSEGVEIISSPATLETPLTTGVVSYAWLDGDTDVAGEFRAEFDVNYGAGELLTIPVKGNLLVQIYEDLNNA